MDAVRSGSPAVAREQLLVAALRGGDWSGIEGLMDSFGDALVHYLASIVNSRQDAEDLFQETWVRAIERIDSFDPQRPFGPWLFRIARNLAYDHLRRRRRFSLFGLAGRRHEAEQPPAEPADTGDFREKLYARDIADRLLARLDPPQREILHLRFWSDLSYEQIAAVCALPIGTVKSRLARALGRLGVLHEGLQGPSR